MNGIKIHFPADRQEIAKLKVKDRVLLSGKIFCGRDAVLPKIAAMIEDGSIHEAPFDLQGGVIFHTAVSPAGVGPTSSNKPEIEGTMGILSSAGILMHLGKGELKKETARILQEYGAVYAVIPPATATLSSRMIDQKVIAFPELGMEAFYELTVEDYPAMIAIAGGESIYDR